MKGWHAHLGTQVTSDDLLALPLERERGLTSGKLFFAQGTLTRIANGDQ